MGAEDVDLSFDARVAANRAAGERLRDQILQLIADYWDSNHYGPSVRDLARQAGCAMSVVAHHLDELEATGMITRAERVARSLRVVERP